MSRTRPTSNKKHEEPSGPPAKQVDTTPTPIGFGHFRKHQKLMLGAAVVFSIVAFALFPSVGNMSSALGGDDAGIVGRFEVPLSGEQVDVTDIEYSRVSRNIGRLAGEVTADDVWSHLMLMADAKAAGLMIADTEMAQELSSGLRQAFGLERDLSRQEYEAFCASRGFSGPRGFEDAWREQLLVGRYVTFMSMGAQVVDSEQVYLRWRVDNERFDFVAAVFDDLELEAVADPSEDDLLAWYEAIPEGQRENRFQDPAKRDIVYAALALDTELETLPQDKLGALTETPDAQVESRFNQVRRERFPDDEEMTDEIRAVLAREVRVIDYAQSAWQAFNELPEEEQLTERFTLVMGEYGLTVEDPEGLLEPEDVKQLPLLGDDRFSNWVTYMQPGRSQVVRPYGEVVHVGVFFVEEGVEARPLDYEEGREQIVTAWKEEQRDRPAQDFRAALVERARALPQAQEEIAPLIAAAEAAAEERLADQPEGDEPLDADAIRAEELELIEADISDRVAQYEHLVWDDVLAAEGSATLLSFEGVPKSYRRNPDEEEAVDSIERFVKTNTTVFAQGVDSLTPVLRQAAQGRSAVVRVTGRELPEKPEMYVDAEGMANARRSLAMQRRFEENQAFTPEQLKATHKLQLVVRDEGEDGGEDWGEGEGSDADEGESDQT